MSHHARFAAGRASVAALSVALSVSSACGTTSPSPPASSTAPVINNLDPNVAVQSDVPERIHVMGTNISSGVTLVVAEPDGGQLTFQASQLSALSLNAFDVTLTLDEAGVYGLQLKNPNGEVSPAVSLPVQGTEESPVIAGTAPAIPVSSPQLQTILIEGSGFAAGLTVRIVDPTGLLVSSGIIGLVAPTQFQISVALAKKGVYVFAVTNPSGLDSNALPVTVQ